MSYDNFSGVRSRKSTSLGKAARRLLGESLVLEQEIGNRLGALQKLEALASVAASERRLEVAVRRAAAALEWRNKVNLPASLREKREQERWLRAARRVLGEAAYITTWTTGAAMSADDAVALATDPVDEPAGAETPGVGRHQQRTMADQRLSAREQEVAALVARGLTNREIATQLSVTERTAGAHIEHILDKLGFASRTQIGVWAAEHELRTQPT